MNGHCTYTVVVYEADGTARDVPCARPRVGQVTGPDMRVVLCKRHAEKVARAILAGHEGAFLFMDAPDLKERA